MATIFDIVFIHFYSASTLMSLSEALPTTAIDTVSELTRRSATNTDALRMSCMLFYNILAEATTDDHKNYY